MASVFKIVFVFIVVQGTDGHVFKSSNTMDVDIFLNDTNVNKLHERIMNGAVGTHDMFPYLVSIQTTLNQHLCGGSILTPFHILTAAHCTFVKPGDKQFSPDELRIRVGPSDLRSPAKVVAKVKWIKIHEEYKKRPIDNDIAVLKVDRSLTSSSNDLAVLPTSFILPSNVSGPCIAAGWGRLGPNPHAIENKSSSNITSSSNISSSDAPNNSSHLSSSYHNETNLNSTFSVFNSSQGINATNANSSQEINSIAVNSSTTSSSVFSNETNLNSTFSVFNSSQAINITNGFNSSQEINTTTVNSSTTPSSVFSNESHVHNGSDNVFGAVSHARRELNLRFTLLPLQDVRECAKDYDMAGITNQVFCAGKRNSLTDTCKGDSGGPLICDGKLEGIVSFGDGCNNPEHLGVYTRVYIHKKWIQKQINSGGNTYHFKSNKYIFLSVLFYVLLYK